jgi:hypothetical protein
LIGASAYQIAFTNLGADRLPGTADDFSANLTSLGGTGVKADGDTLLFSRPSVGWVDLFTYGLGPDRLPLTADDVGESFVVRLQSSAIFSYSYDIHDGLVSWIKSAGAFTGQPSEIGFCDVRRVATSQGSCALPLIRSIPASANVFIGGKPLALRDFSLGFEINLIHFIASQGLFSPSFPLIFEPNFGQFAFWGNSNLNYGSRLLFGTYTIVSQFQSGSLSHYAASPISPTIPLITLGTPRLDPAAMYSLSIGQAPMTGPQGGAQALLWRDENWTGPTPKIFAQMFGGQSLKEVPFTQVSTGPSVTIDVFDHNIDGDIVAAGQVERIAGTTVFEGIVVSNCQF